MPLSQTGHGTYVLTVGADDDLDGISLVVAGEEYPRVSITSAGVAVGDGTEAPTLLEVPV